jgi:CPA2 family monovalent cation:H+ antiporter-2
VVRTRYVSEIARLDALGTDEVVAEEFETSIEIFSRVLMRYQVPDAQIERSIHEVREDAYELLRTGLAARPRPAEKRAGDDTA